MPGDLVNAVLRAKDKQAIKQIGIEWCAEQTRELKARHVPIIHYYSMGKSDNITAILESI